MSRMQDVVRRLTVVHTTPGAEQAARQIRGVRDAMREAATSSVSYERATLAVERADMRGVAQMRAYTRAVAESAAAQRALASARGAISGNMGLAAGLVGGYAGYAAAAAGVALLISRAGNAVTAYRKFEDAQTTLQGALRATDGAAGRTAGQIEALVREVGNVGEARSAAQALLAYDRVQGDVYDRTLRLAKDLSAAGFGDLQSSARTLGQALQDPAQGLAALEAAGIRFGARQKAMIIDMAETGRQAEAQRKTLDLLHQAVGGSGAARAGTLSGAYEVLSDAVARNSEQLGRQIVEATRLTSVVHGLASALNTITDFRISKEASDFLTRAGTSLAATPFGVPLLAAGALIPATQGADPSAKKRAADMAEAQSIADSFGAMRQQRDTYESVVLALEKERRAIQQTNLEREIERRQREAGVAATSQIGQSIAAEVTQNERLKAAKEAAAEAERKRLAQAARGAEFERRTAEHRRTTIENLMQERDALFMSAEAARATALAQAELAKYRERGVAVSDSLRGDVDAWARQVAEIERVNRSIAELKSTMTDFAVGFARDLRNGVSAAEALGNAFDRLADKLIDMAVQNLVGQAFGLLGSGGGSGLLSGMTKLLGSADGNVFAGGNVIPFARGGVVTAPTIFPMANGMGLMGEAGPEAVMPLRRTPDGRLGVAASGDRRPAVSVVVNEAPGTQAQVSAGPEGEITVDIVAALDGALSDRAARGRGGLAKTTNSGRRLRG